MKALESKVFNMQEDFLKLKYENQQQQLVQQPQPQHQVPQQIYPPHLPPQYPPQAQPIIVQVSELLLFYFRVNLSCS